MRQKEPKKDKTQHTTNSQRLLIIEWLQIPDNFKLITGSAAFNNNVTSGTKLKRTDAYRLLATMISKNSGITWTADQAKNRYESYLALYKKTRIASNQTGWGLTELELNEGLLSIEDKLEQLCPFFTKMEELFGNRENISPTHTLETDMPTINSNQGLLISTQNHLTPSHQSINSLDDEGDAEITKRSRDILNPMHLSIKKVKKDFSSIYAENSSEMIKLNSQKFCLETKNKERELLVMENRLAFEQTQSENRLSFERSQSELRLAMEREQFDKTIMLQKEKDDKIFKSEFLTKLIETGKTPLEIDEYLKIFNKK